MTCYELDPKRGLNALPFFLSIPQTELEDPTTPPAGPLTIAADIRFNPTSSALLVTVRSNGGKSGILYSWPVQYGEIIQKPANNSLPDIPFPFSINFLSSDSRFFLTNPHLDSAGAAIVELSPTGTVTNIQTITIPGQLASCWVAYDPSLKSVFVADALRPVITIVDTVSGEITGSTNFSTPTLGGVDSKVDRNYLYQLTAPVNTTTLDLEASPHVLVYNIADVGDKKTLTQKQSFDIFSAVGEFPGVFGLAVYPAAALT